MQMTRREAIKRAGLTVVGLRLAAGASIIGMSELSAGCPTAQQWFQIVGALLPIVGQTYLQFYGFARGGVDAGDIAKVQNLTTAGQDIIDKIGGPNGLLSTYEANKSAGTLAEINALLTQAQQDVNAFLTDVQIKNSAKFAQYSAFAQAILADIKDIISLVPVVAANGKTTQKVPYEKAKTFEGTFKARLAALPK